jgi:opacity protein-like surface antigen
MKRLAMAAALCMLAFSAHAQESVIAEGDELVTEGQWRVAASAAFSDYKGDTTGIDDSTVGFKLSGQRQFNDWFGVEGAYMNTSDFSSPQNVVNNPGGDRDVAFRGFSFAGVGYIPLGGDDFDIYGLLGYFDFDTDLVQNGVVDSSGHTDGMMVGAGVTLGISDNFGIKAEFDWYDVDEADLWSMLLGLEYRF